MFNTLVSSVYFWWGIGVSVFMVIVFLPGAVWILLRLPPDFLQRERRTLLERFREGGWWWKAGLVLKNLLAIVFLVAGVLMLFLPGQGLLAIVAGLVLLDFPGKQALERWVITQKSVLATVNWLRRWCNRPELDVRREGNRAPQDSE